ncbi:outer membrane efflux protein [Candidatus Symbiothrix dinenymphae]|nr:outer membrane efflux protein [Candidatus Symbiothrix dinenymphae]
MFFLSFGFLACSAAFGQVSIEDCYDKARANYPQIKQYGLIERARGYNLSNVSKAWMPQAQLSAKATYQSDVTSIPIDFSKLGMPGVSIPSIDKDQYGATLEISQTIWDGGLTGAKRKGIRAKAEAEEREVDVTLYAVRERINQLFFGILLCNAMLEQNKLFQDELQVNHDRINNLMQGGLANQADLDAVRVEQLKAKQGFTQISHSRKAYLEMLSAFIGEKLDEAVRLQKPVALQVVSPDINRPELSLFDANLKSLDAAKSEIDAGLMPKFGLFLTGGYGKPGLNMLESEFSAYYIGGVRLTWNIGSFYTRKNSLNLLESNRNAVQTQRETFVFNTSLNKTGKENEIDKYRELLKTDDEIIALRNSVRRAAEAKVENGTLTATDLMHEANAEQLARQDKIVHEIEWLQAIYNLKFITNNW